MKEEVTLDVTIEKLLNVYSDPKETKDYTALLAYIFVKQLALQKQQMMQKKFLFIKKMKYLLKNLYLTIKK
ncbi:MAG: hypothetical protein R2837_11210 [Aliarcobacter sp.]